MFVDDRFILKQMSRFEVQSFLEFAPHYFKYVTMAHSEQVGIRNVIVKKYFDILIIYFQFQ